MSASSNLALPFLAQAQAQKHVTINESLLRLDALVQLSVASATVTAQPASPTDGQIYILPAGKTGADWGAMANGALAYYRDGIWEQLTPQEGWVAFVRDTEKFCVYSGAAWTAFAVDKLLTVSATDRVLGRVSSGAGAAEEVTFTDQAQQLCDDTSFAAMRTTLSAAGLSDANTFSSTGAQTIVGPAGASGATDAAFVLRANDDGSTGVRFSMFTNSASPAASDFVGQWRVWGKDSAGNDQIYGDLSVVINDPTSGSEDAEIRFQTVTAGSVGRCFTAAAGVYLPGATGGDKGVGTLNATAVYDDNVLLTCGPIELMRSGRIDFDKWDAIADARQQKAPGAPPRQHAAMRMLETMLADGFDPRDPDNFCARMHADGAAPGLFTEAEWSQLAEAGEKPDIGGAITRTFLAIDNLAVAFAALVARNATLEERVAKLER